MELFEAADLFCIPRLKTMCEKRMLQSIEKATGQPIELMQLPSSDLVNNRRIEKFKQRISDTLAGEGFDPEDNTDGRRVVTLIGDASIGVNFQKQPSRLHSNRL